MTYSVNIIHGTNHFDFENRGREGVFHKTGWREEIPSISVNKAFKL